MRTLCLVILAVFLFAPAAFGQAGAIGLFPDAGLYSQCNVTDFGPALVPVYMVHKLTPGATASQFMVVSGGGFTCTYTGEIIAVPVSIGSAITGLSASYGGCYSSDILIGTINYFCMGTNPPCAHLRVVPDVAAPTGTIEVVNCSFVKLEGAGGILFFNSPWCGDDCPVPTRNTSWGAVKALYK